MCRLHAAAERLGITTRLACSCALHCASCRWSVTSAALDYTSPAALNSGLQPPDYATTITQARCHMHVLGAHRQLLVPWRLCLPACAAKKHAALQYVVVALIQTVGLWTWLVGRFDQSVCRLPRVYRSSRVQAAAAHLCTQQQTLSGRTMPLQHSGVPQGFHRTHGLWHGTPFAPSFVKPRC